MSTGNDSAEQKLTPPPTNVMWTAILISVAIGVVVGWQMGLFDSPSVELTAAIAPASPPEDLVEKDPFWVAVKVKGTLPTNTKFRCAVSKKGEVIYQRPLERQQLEKGQTLDLAVKKSGTAYDAVVEVYENDKPGKRVSNVLTFTH